jgi:hypothetical protein
VVIGLMEKYLMIIRGRCKREGVEETVSASRIRE